MPEQKPEFFSIAGIEGRRQQKQKPYLEFLRAPSMSAGLYVLSEGATDLQRPHHEDEMYYVVRGRGRFRAGDQDQEVSVGTVLFVPAEVPHHFHGVSEELAVLVFFAPAES